MYPEADWGKAGYAELDTGKLTRYDVPVQWDYVAKHYGQPKMVWATRVEPGAPGIPEHAHNRHTVVYYPHDHAVGTWVDGTYHEAVEGTYIDFAAGVMHHVEANDTDDTRYTLVFTLEKK